MTSLYHFPGCHPDCAPQGDAMSTPADALTDATANYRHAQATLNATRDTLAEAVRDAIESGMSQSEASRIVGVDRLTIRKWAAQ